MKKPLLFGIILTACVVIVAFVFSLGYPGGMISYWKFDEDSEATASDSVDANHGTIYGATRTTGIVGDALSFDGVDDYVDAGTGVNLKFGTGAFTVEAWINANSLAGTGTATWFVARHSSNDSAGFRFGYWNHLVFRDRSSQVDVFGSTLTTGTWTHVVAVREGIGANQLKLYINGVLDGEGTSAGNFNDDSPLYIGRPGGPWVNTDHFDGKIDEVAIYNRALSAEEIQQHYENGSYEVECVLPPDSLVSWWPGDGNADDIWNGNHGTVNGAIFSTGIVGQAFSFDGLDDYVELPASSSILTDSPFTISAWIITDVQQGTYGGDEGRIVNLHRQDAYSTSASIYAGGPASGEPGDRDDICFLYYTGSDHKWLCYQTTSPVYHDGNPHLITATHNGSTVKLYYDGVEVRTRNDAFGTFGTATAKIGSFNGGERYFDGVIDEVAIFDEVLTADEIQAIYIAGSAGKCKVRTVDIDIKPGSDPNCFNSNAHGVIPVAILGSENFDVRTINPFTVTLDGQEVRVKGKSGNAGSLKDVNGDGFDDLVVQILDNDVYGNDVGTTIGTITAFTLDGKRIEGKDSICITQD